MSHSWNAYKVFKSGKRAKAPVMTFDCDGGSKEVEQKFFTDILPGLNEKGATGCLMLSKETGWKWRWCAVAPATNNHYCNLTDGFDSYDEAMGWMQEQCRKM